MGERQRGKGGCSEGWGEAERERGKDRMGEAERERGLLRGIARYCEVFWGGIVRCCEVLRGVCEV
jgi:hypothetical protein